SDDRNRDPPDGAAGARPEAGPALPAAARTAGDGTRQPDSGVFEVLPRGTQLLPHQAGGGQPREVGDDATQGSPLEGTAPGWLRQGPRSPAAGQLCRPPRHPRLAAFAEDQARGNWVPLP